MLRDVVAVTLLGVLALGGALLLRERSPGSWPRSLAVLLPLGAAVSVLVVLLDAATHLGPGLGPREGWLPAVLVGAAAVILVLTRWGGGSWVGASWLAGAVLLIGLTTLPSGEAGPHLAADAPGQLRSCLLTEHRVPLLGIPRPEGSVSGGSVSGGTVTGVSVAQGAVMSPATPRLLSGHWVGVLTGVTTSLLPALDMHKLTSEQLPNVALFAPLGIGIAAVARRRTGWWVALAVGLSVGVESYQAVFTSRTCSTVDVATNAVGLFVGWAVYVIANRLALPSRRRPATPGAGGR